MLKFDKLFFLVTRIKNDIKFLLKKKNYSKFKKI